MKTHLYYIDCITNLHVGSGDANFNIIDKEVEKDPINHYPIIHASGIKGALRDHAKKISKIDEGIINKVFGKPNKENELAQAGEYCFFNADMLFRPMRAAGIAPSVNVTTLEMIETFKATCNSFGISLPEGLENFDESKLNFQTPFFVSTKGINNIEGDEVKVLDESFISALNETMNKKTFAIAKLLDDYSLPIVARNNLMLESGGLWYEEYVPRGSRFFMLVMTPDDDAIIDKIIPELVQIGGNSSIGYGYCRFTRVNN